MSGLSERSGKVTISFLRKTAFSARILATFVWNASTHCARERHPTVAAPAPTPCTDGVSDSPTGCLSIRWLAGTHLFLLLDTEALEVDALQAATQNDDREGLVDCGHARH